ncbi:MAG: hypothetical protein ACRECH_06085 [Nitrososphaerales archaeon]
MSSDSVLQSLSDREFAYLLSGIRLRANQTIPRLDAGSIHLDPANQNDIFEVPRWIAEVLTKLGFCEAQEESFASEVFKAVNREKMAGENQLATLRSDFYLKIRRHLAYSRGLAEIKPSSVTDLDRTKTLIYDLIRLRLRKILLTASSLSPPSDIKGKLTPEEYQIFDSIYILLQSWRTGIMEGRGK